MACEKPLKIKNRRYVGMTDLQVSQDSKERYGMIWPPDYILEVPCGYCHSCQKSQNNQYRIRLMYEIRDHPPDSCLFLTLTFNDPSEARFSADYNKAVRLFLDRLRKRYGKQIRHWFICEFGTKRGRAHYHGILFNCPDDLLHDARNSPLVGGVPGRLSVVNDLWSYGFTFTGYVSDATCSYITKYLTKSLNDRKVRPRVLSSFGIGVGYLKTDDAALHKLDKDKPQPFMFLNGFK